MNNDLFIKCMVSILVICVIAMAWKYWNTKPKVEVQYITVPVMQVAVPKEQPKPSPRVQGFAPLPA